MWLQVLGSESNFLQMPAPGADRSALRRGALDRGGALARMDLAIEPAADLELDLVLERPIPIERTASGAIDPANSIDLKKKSQLCTESALPPLTYEAHACIITPKADAETLPGRRKLV